MSRSSEEIFFSRFPRCAEESDAKRISFFRMFRASFRAAIVSSAFEGMAASMIRRNFAAKEGDAPDVDTATMRSPCENEEGTINVQ